MINKLQEYIDTEIIDVKSIMTQRNKQSKMNHDNYTLFEIKDFSLFVDPEDESNHNYDLGRLKTLKEIKTLIGKWQNE